MANVMVDFGINQKSISSMLTELQKTLGDGLKDIKVSIKDIDFSGAAKKFADSLNDAMKDVDFSKSINMREATAGTHEAVKQIVSELSQVRKALDGINSAMSASKMEEMVTRGAAAIGRMVDKLQEVRDMVDSINNKDFNITNTVNNFNKGGVDKSWFALQTQHAMALKAAVESVKSSLAGMNRVVKESMSGDAFSQANILQGYQSPNGLGTQTGVIKGIAEMTEYISRATAYIDQYNAKVVEMGATNVPQIQLPDMSRVQETMRAIDEYAGVVKEAQSASAGVGGATQTQLANEARELKTVVDEIGLSFDSIRDKIGSAFNLSEPIDTVNKLKSEVDMLGESIASMTTKLERMSNARISRDERALIQAQGSLLSSEMSTTKRAYESVLSSGRSGAELNAIKDAYADLLTEITAVKNASTAASEEEIALLQQRAQEVREMIAAYREGSQYLGETGAARRAREEDAAWAQYNAERAGEEERASAAAAAAAERDYAKRAAAAEAAADRAEKAWVKSWDREVAASERATAATERAAERESAARQRAALQEANLQKQTANLRAQISAYANNNSRAYQAFGSQLDGMLNELSQEGGVTKERLAEIATEFTNIKAAASEAGVSGSSFMEKLQAGWQKFGGWSLITKSFMQIVRLSREAVESIKEIDLAMTELRKVTDLTATGYQRFYESAAKVSSQIGATVSDTINASADFARLGFSAEDSLALANASLVYKNVGDGIDTVAQASESMISTMKAFGIETQNSMQIVDMFNEVGKLLPMPVVTRCLAECYIGQSSVWFLCA